jgi:hypothetical protein
MRKGLLLSAIALVLITFTLLTPGSAAAKACITQPNTPVFNGSGTNCSNAYGPAITAAFEYATSACAAKCSSVCLYNFVGGDCTGTGPYYASGYGSFGCTTPPPNCNLNP